MCEATTRSIPQGDSTRLFANLSVLTKYPIKTVAFSRTTTALANNLNERIPVKTGCSRGSGSMGNLFLNYCAVNIISTEYKSKLSHR
jgi:hypothetical protein